MNNSTSTELPINLNTTSSYIRPFDETGVIVSAFILITFLVLGLIGNGLTIAVISTYRVLHENVFINFILSLCVSDFISAMISWLFLYRRTWGFEQWEPLPGIFCKFYWSADIMTSYVTAGHIFSFALLRLIAIQFPQFFKKITLRHTRIWMACIWIVCFLAGFIPSWTIFGARVRDPFSNTQDARWPACTILREQLDFYHLFQKTTFPIFIYFPTIGVVIASAIILLIVYSRSRLPINQRKRSLRKEKQAVLQLILIIISFLIGYIPFTAYEFWSIQKFPNTHYYHVVDYWFGMTEYILLRFSECLNPVFYNLGANKVRRHTVKFVKEKIFCCAFERTSTFVSKKRPPKSAVGSSNDPTVS